MKVSSLVVLVYACGSLVPGSNALVTGINATKGEFPYTVSIKEQDSLLMEFCPICAGVIISKDWILTTGSCLSMNYPRSLGAWYGNVAQDCESEFNITQGVIGKASYVPPGFEEIVEIQNIGLLKLSTPLNFSDTVQPIKLPEIGAKMPNKTGTVSGWGCIDNEKRIWPGTLQKVDLTIYEDKFCKSQLEDKLEYFNASQTFCAGRTDVNMSTAVISYQDDGAPFVIDGVLWGLASFNLRLVESPLPSTFTRVSEFRSWINEMTGL